MGRSGCDAVLHHVPRLRQNMAIDLVIVNGENAAAGFGMTPPIVQSLLDGGVDIITSGNHIWDKPEIIPYIAQEPRLLRPLNEPSYTPGQGITLLTLPHHTHSVVVVNVMGRVFMDHIDDPFVALETVFQKYRLGHNVSALVVDIHAEAASEKMAIGHFCDGRASLVIGTHSHIPTADAHILEHGTAYQTDAGMCGDYRSVIGMEKEDALKRMRHMVPRPRLKPARGEATLCGVVTEVDPRTGLARWIQPLRLGGVLSPCQPLIPADPQQSRAL